ncbi:transformer-2 protein homolog beta-like [Teleopsis dalmanni]|uniref:transformer-2 protein homolog beta-like n=1 Tax=Teleopsis dalmanni TaxID=139649 RepID=UPI0018CF47AC|nr:transformer-2 protein homolog beta-like [Teleopsis dalmanni]XP_037938932.1 transformer-2 protein homolog beta-like [Teleopsis dalmanni]
METEGFYEPQSSRSAVSKERRHDANGGYRRFSSPFSTDNKRARYITRYSRNVSRSNSPGSYRSRSCSRVRYRSRSYTRMRWRSPSYSRERRRYSPSPGYRREHRYFHSPSNLEQERARLHPEPCSCVGIFGLSVTTGAACLESIFSKFGPIDDIYLVKDGTTGHSRGFAFIYFKRLFDAEKAVRSSSNLIIHRRKVRVAFSITKQPHKSTPGIYMGRDRRELTFYRHYQHSERSNYRHPSYERRYNND